MNEKHVLSWLVVVLFLMMIFLGWKISEMADVLNSFCWDYIRIDGERLHHIGTTTPSKFIEICPEKPQNRLDRP